MNLTSGNVALPFEGFDIDPRQDVLVQDESLSIPAVLQRYEGTSFDLNREGHSGEVPLLHSIMSVGKGRLSTMQGGGYRPIEDWRRSSNMLSQRSYLTHLGNRAREIDPPGSPGDSEYWFQQPVTHKRKSKSASRSMSQKSGRTSSQQFHPPGRSRSPLLSPTQAMAALRESLEMRMREQYEQTTSNAFPMELNRKNYAKFGSRGTELSDRSSGQQSDMVIRCVPCNLLFYDSQSCAEHKANSLHQHLVEQERLKGIDTVEFEFMIGEDKRELQVKPNMDLALMEHANHGNPYLDNPLLSARSDDSGLEYNGISSTDHIEFEPSHVGPSASQPGGVVTSHGEYYTSSFVDTAIRSKVGSSASSRLGSGSVDTAIQSKVGNSVSSRLGSGSVRMSSDPPIRPPSPPYNRSAGDLRSYLQRNSQQRLPLLDAPLPSLTTPHLASFAQPPPSHTLLSSHGTRSYLPHNSPLLHPRLSAPHPPHFRPPVPRPPQQHPPRSPQVRAKLSPAGKKQSLKKQSKATGRVQPPPKAPAPLQSKPGSGIDKDKKVQVKVPVTCICELCDRKFNSVAALRNHVKSHVHLKAIEESSKAIQVQYNEDEECDVVQVFRICIEKKKVWSYAYLKSIDGLVSDAPHSKFRFVCPVCNVEYNKGGLLDAKAHFNGKKHRLKVKVCTEQRNEMVIEKY